MVSAKSFAQQVEATSWPVTCVPCRPQLGQVAAHHEDLPQVSYHRQLHAACAPAKQKVTCAYARRRSQASLSGVQDKRVCIVIAFIQQSIQKSDLEKEDKDGPG